MPLIKNSSIEEIKAKVRIEDLVSRYVQLKKVGANYRGLSPFKHEKTPSFYVYPDKNFYYCFSTSQGGDIFKFVQTKENMSFVEAAEFIADRFGIRLEYERGAKAGAGSSVRKQIFDINEDAAAYYSAEFFAKNPRAESVRNYWTQERKFTLENAKELRIGFSPTDAEGLKKILAKKNYSPDALRECGLFFARESEADLARFHPRFRGRLMIPISDGQGRVIAFTARKTEFTPSDIAYEEGKYVNSPETPVFKKNMTLFNFDRAKKEAERRGYFILAEGQLDTIRMYCSGLENTVASQGTAAGAEHFALMKRHADRVVLLFDGDSAGRHAALRAIPICIAADIEPFVAQLPPDDDPDSFIAKNGADAMRELVENDKLPANLVKRLNNEYPDFLKVVNEIYNKDYTIESLLAEFKPHFLAGKIMSPTSVLYASKTFSELMGFIPAEETEKPVLPEGVKPGRNDLCPCGSGKKYKKCCGMV